MATNLLNYLYFLSVFFISTYVWAENTVDVIFESGAVWQSRNDIQIPPDTGTRLEADKINEGPLFHYRIESYYPINNNHALRAVYAPFNVQVTGPVDTAVTFNGKSFSAAEDLSVRYQFNSYRLSYIYGFWGFGENQINLGFTGKIRDASLSFSQPGIESSYSNVGFVPLIYFEYQTALGPHWMLNFTVDAAGAAQGRAIDAAIKLRRYINRHSSLGLGVRSLEGGADNKKVFTFSWFNYAVVDLKVAL